LNFTSIHCLNGAQLILLNLVIGFSYWVYIWMMLRREEAHFFEYEYDKRPDSPPPRSSGLIIAGVFFCAPIVLPVYFFWSRRTARSALVGLGWSLLGIFVMGLLGEVAQLLFAD
jgi:hypothetical protein